MVKFRCRKNAKRTGGAFCLPLVTMAFMVLAFGGSSRAADFRLMPHGSLTVQQSRQTGDDIPFSQIYEEQFVAWGGSAVTIDLRAKPDHIYRLTAFFIEAYWSETGKRLVTISAENAPLETIDLVTAAGGGNKPLSHTYNVQDADGDGWIQVAVQAAVEAGDNNAVLNGLMLEDITPGLDPAKETEGKIIVNCGNEILSNLRSGPVLDGRPVFGNGYVLGTFVGPLEMPEAPVTEVHDKIARLWLGYSSPQMSQVGLAAVVADGDSGQTYAVGACDSYAYEDGALIMETDLPIGHMRTETFGVWDQPLMVRRFVFTPAAGFEGPFRLTTAMQLFADYAPEPAADDPETERVFKQAYSDTREIPPALSFPENETISLDRNAKIVQWDYNNPHYRKVAVKALEPGAVYHFGDEDPAGLSGDSASFTGAAHGRLGLEVAGKGEPVTLTVVLAFGVTHEAALLPLSETDPGELALETVQRHWRDWLDSGAVVTTGQAKLDHAYRSQMMGLKLAQDAELGGLIVGSRYHLTTVWTRDGGVGITALLSAGHYAEAKKALAFFARHATWDVTNNCLHANYHASGRVLAMLTGAGQPPVEEILYPFGVIEGKACEWGLQMTGPQLDGMAYWLFNIGMYERLTGDLDFVREVWPFIMRVADSLASDMPQIAFNGQPGELIDAHKRYPRYHPQTGLIVDMCCEDGGYREHLIMNGMTVMGLREVYRLSGLMGGAVPLWADRADSIDAAIKKNLVQENAQGAPYMLEWVSRPWLDGGSETRVRQNGYSWTMASVIPYFSWRDPVFRECFARQVEADGRIGAWGMWWAELAHTAFEAGQPETAWNYLTQVVDALPVSGLMYEHNQDVAGAEGDIRHATLNLFGFAYLPPALIRGLAGYGFDALSGQYFFRPQLPKALGEVRSRVKIGQTWFAVTTSGAGDTYAEFTIDGQPQPPDGLLDAKWLDGTRHEVVVRMK